MTKEEKEKLLDYIDSQINCVELGEDYLAGENYAYKDVREYVETMEITEPKETNLERTIQLKILYTVQLMKSTLKGTEQL